MNLAIAGHVRADCRLAFPEPHPPGQYRIERRARFVSIPLRKAIQWFVRQ